MNSPDKFANKLPWILVEQEKVINVLHQKLMIDEPHKQDLTSWAWGYNIAQVPIHYSLRKAKAYAKDLERMRDIAHHIAMVPVYLDHISNLRAALEKVGYTHAQIELASQGRLRLPKPQTVPTLIRIK